MDCMRHTNNIKMLSTDTRAMLTAEKGEVYARKLDEIRLIMECLNLKSDDLSADYGASSAMIRKILGGSFIPKRPLLRRIGNALERVSRNRTDELREALEYRLDLICRVLDKLDESAD